MIFFEKKIINFLYSTTKLKKNIDYKEEKIRNYGIFLFGIIWKN